MKSALRLLAGLLLLAVAPRPDAPATPDWFAGARQAIEEEQARLSPRPLGGWTADSPAGFRVIFDAGETSVSAADGTWEWSYRFLGAGETAVPEASAVDARRFTRSYTGGIEEIWDNLAEGMEHSFRIPSAPPGEGPLRLTGVVGGTLVGRTDGDRIVFADAERNVLVYEKLLVNDADGRLLASRMKVEADTLTIEIDDAGARYPILVDPLLTTPSWIVDPVPDTLANGILFAYSVATAGDVNGDGYADVLVGCPRYTGSGAVDHGKVYVFHGSATGLPTNATYTLEPITTQGAWFGESVASAGDVNADGYSDVIVGAPKYTGAATGEGRVYVFLGGPTGLSAAGPWTADPTDTGNAKFGTTVASAGDVDGNGCSDLIVGTFNSWAYVYLCYSVGGGFDTWFPWNSDPYKGGAVAGAGDVNADGYDDIVIGDFTWSASLEGRACVWHGSAGGLTQGGAPNWTADPTNENSAYFGNSVSTAGDVNGDGYADVVIGARGWDGSGTLGAGEGRAYVYYGGAAGLGGAPWTADPTNDINGYFGWSVSCAGDVNGDGYADIIVGAPGWGVGNQGGAYSYYGRSGGLVQGGPWSWFVEPTAAGSSNFGTTAAGAGDFNGDGYSDVIVGAPYWYNTVGYSEGRAYAYVGAASGLPSTGAFVDPVVSTGGNPAQFGKGVHGIGDFNGDGYDDAVAGAPGFDGEAADEGCVYVYFGGPSGLNFSSPWTAHPTNVAGMAFGEWCTPAGDLNGDGYSDLAVTSPNYNSQQGRIYVYYGKPASLLPGPNDPADWEASLLGPGAYFGYGGGIGDVNGDGFGDLAVAAPGFDGEAPDEGRVYVYYGSSAGLPAGSTPSWQVDPTDQAGAMFARAAPAGDVNRDGFGDMIVGVPNWDGNGGTLVDEGAVWLYFGSASGLVGGGAPWVIEPANAAGAQYGHAAASAGDVNGDGYSDVVVGAHGAGKAYAYYGGTAFPSGSWQVAVGAGTEFGLRACGIGDVNGDGLSEIIVGERGYSGATSPQEGRVHVYYGNSGGLPPTAGWQADPADQTSAGFSDQLGPGGDLNGDGYADVIVAASDYDDPAAGAPGVDKGRVYVFYGNNGGSLSLVPQQWRGDGTARVQRLGGTWGSDARVRLLGRSYVGRTRVKVQWEVKPLGSAFDMGGLETGSTWVDSGLAGATIEDVVGGLTANTSYHWRARVVMFPHTTSRWVSVGPNGAQEADFRTSAGGGGGGGEVPPTAPTGLLCEDLASPASNIQDPTPEFRAQFNDPNAADASDQYEIEVIQGGAVIWSSGPQSYAGGGTVAQGALMSNAQKVPYGGATPLQWNQTYDWRIKMKDAGGSWSAWSSPAQFTMSSPSGTLSPAMTAPGDPWHIVSVPIGAGSIPVSELQDDLGAGAVFYAWNEPTQTYVTVTTLQAGRGYWVSLPNGAGTTVDIQQGAAGGGTFVWPTATYPLTNDPGSTLSSVESFYAIGSEGGDGWHLLANPFNAPLDWSSVTTSAGVQAAYYIWDPAVPGQWRWYNKADGTQYPAAWASAAVIPPFQAYWVRVTTGAETISAPPPGAFNNPVIPPPTTPNSWRLEIAAQSGAFSDGGLFAGVHPAALDAHDERDVFKMIGGADLRIWFPQPTWNEWAGRYAQDVRTPVTNPGDTVVWTIEVEATAGATVTIAAPNVADMPTTDWMYIIEDPDSGAVADLSAGGYAYTQPAGLKTLLLKAVRLTGVVGSLVATIGAQSPAPATVPASAAGLTMLQMKLEAQGEPMTIDTIRVWGLGTADDASAVSAAWLHLDADADGAPDAVLAGPSAFGFDDGFVDFAGLGLLLNAGETTHVIVTYDLSGTAGGGQTLATTLMPPADVIATGAWTGQPISGVGGPVVGATMTVEASASGGGSSPAPSAQRESIVGVSGGGGSGGGGCHFFSFSAPSAGVVAWIPLALILAASLLRRTRFKGERT